MIGSRHIEEDQIQTRSRELEKTKKTENYNTRERHREKKRERQRDRDRDREMVASGGQNNTWGRSQRAHGAPGWDAGERARSLAPNGQQQRTAGEHSAR